MAISRRITRGGPPVFNVKTFGAVGNGTTDDTTAILAAVAAAEAQPYFATVFLPFGYYKITSPIVISRPIKLQGEGCVVGDRLKNNNYAAKGAVLWNASTTGDAIQFRPSTISGLWPRGLGGMIFQDFGIDTPELGGAAVSSTNAAGWGPLSTGSGIACYVQASSPYKIPFYCQYRNVTVCRHYNGFDMNRGTTASYYSGCHDFSWCNAFLCRNKGFNCDAVESRLLFCRAKNNDPEWTSWDANPARAAIGFYLGADGSFLSNCIAITCDIGYHGEGNGYHLLENCGADSSAQGYEFSGIASGQPVQIANCWNSSVYFNPVLATYPDSGRPGFNIGSGGSLINCNQYLGSVGFYAAGGKVIGGKYASGNASLATLLSGVEISGTLTRGTLFSGSVMGCNATTIAGSAGTSKGRGNIGVADWG